MGGVWGLFGLNPVLVDDEHKRSASEPASFIPSTFSRKNSTLTEFRELTVESPYAGDKKILVLGTSKYLLPTTSAHRGEERFFNTGHHTTETLLPMYHFDKLGFKFDIATEDGAPLALEEWTFPLAKGYEDKLREMLAKVKEKVEKPLRYEDVPEDLGAYAAVFLPGGHGPIISMYKDEILGNLLRSAHNQEMLTISLCHGPSSFRAAELGGTDFPYRGYKIAVFPDSMDKTSPKFGYLPGYLSEEYLVESKLRALGFEVVNKKMDDTVSSDRELITGASQLSAQRLGEAAAKALAERFGAKLG